MWGEAGRIHPNFGLIGRNTARIRKETGKESTTAGLATYPKIGYKRRLASDSHVSEERR